MRVTTKRYHTGSHWGLYDVEVEDGKLVGIQPFADDPHPTPLVHALPSAVYHPSRITQPMVRKGYLAKGF
jgi:biotin/methionine sulfoxide reductase